MFARESEDPQAALIDLSSELNGCGGYGYLVDESVVLTARLWEAIRAVPGSLRGVCSAWERLETVLYVAGQAIDEGSARVDLQVFLPTAGSSRICRLRAVRCPAQVTIGFPTEL